MIINKKFIFGVIVMFSSVCVAGERTKAPVPQVQLMPNTQFVERNGLVWIDIPCSDAGGQITECLGSPQPASPALLEIIRQQQQGQQTDQSIIPMSMMQRTERKDTNGRGRAIEVARAF
jgi:hypothetical protein